MAAFASPLSAGMPKDEISPERVDSPMMMMVNRSRSYPPTSAAAATAATISTSTKFSTSSSSSFRDDDVANLARVLAQTRSHAAEHIQLLTKHIDKLTAIVGQQMKQIAALEKALEEARRTTGPDKLQSDRTIGGDGDGGGGGGGGGGDELPEDAGGSPELTSPRKRGRGALDLAAGCNESALASQLEQLVQNVGAAVATLAASERAQNESIVELIQSCHVNASSTSTMATTNILSAGLSSPMGGAKDKDKDKEQETPTSPPPPSLSSNDSEENEGEDNEDMDEGEGEGEGGTKASQRSGHVSATFSCEKGGDGDSWDRVAAAREEAERSIELMMKKNNNKKKGDGTSGGMNTSRTTTTAITATATTSSSSSSSSSSSGAAGGSHGSVDGHDHDSVNDSHCHNDTFDDAALTPIPANTASSMRCCGDDSSMMMAMIRGGGRLDLSAEVACCDDKENLVVGGGGAMGSSSSSPTVTCGSSSSSSSSSGSDSAPRRRRAPSSSSTSTSPVDPRVRQRLGEELYAAVNFLPVRSGAGRTPVRRVVRRGAASERVSE